MKITGLSAIMLLLGATSAYSKKEYIAYELGALSKLIDTMEEPKAASIFA
jgi:hypothetical protein